MIPPKRKKPVQRAYKGLVGLLPVDVPEESRCEYLKTPSGYFVCRWCNHNPGPDDMTAEGFPAARHCSKRIVATENKEIFNKEFDAEQAERDKRAKAARERQQKKADELAAIKEKLRTPVAVIIAEAKQKALEERVRQQERRGHMSKGMYMTDAPKGKGLIISGGFGTSGDSDISTISGVSAAQHGGVEPWFEEGHQGPVRPEGVGRKPEAREENDNDDYDPNGTRDPWTQESEENAVKFPDAPIIDGDSFLVNLNDADVNAELEELANSGYFAKFLAFEYGRRCTKCGALQDDEVTASEDDYLCINCGAKHAGSLEAYICRLCGSWETRLSGPRRAGAHMLTAHGADNPDPRFGDVVSRWRKGGRKLPNIDKALQKAKKPVTP